MPDLFVEAQRASVERRGATLAEPATFSITASRSIVIGLPGALLPCLVGLSEITSGTLRVAGLAPRNAIAARRLAGALCDFKWPDDLSLRDVLLWSARVAGSTKEVATKRAAFMLEALKLTPLANARASAATPVVRRAVSIASALATEAPYLIFEDPLQGVAESEARTFGSALVAAIGDRGWVMVAKRFDAAHPLLSSCEHVYIFERDHFVAQGTPREFLSKATVRIQVSGDVLAFEAALSAEHVDLKKYVDGSYIIELAEKPAHTLFRIALAVGVNIEAYEPLSIPKVAS